MLVRPRRNRRSVGLRSLVREASLSASHLVFPMFVQEGQGQATPIASMPGQARLTVDLLVEKAREAFELGVPAVEIFPLIPDAQKDPRAAESTNAAGLVPRAVRALKAALPELVVITD